MGDLRRPRLLDLFCGCRMTSYASTMSEALR